jgi:hypothetical protein
MGNWKLEIGNLKWEMGKRAPHSDIIVCEIILLVVVPVLVIGNGKPRTRTRMRMRMRTRMRMRLRMRTPGGVPP